MAKLMRDAVHGDIELNSLEIELIDTPEFQRLRGIKQLGTAYLVFPSAVHTRFEHSIGTAWMAHRIIEVLRKNRSVSEAQEDLIRAAALLHDVTHIPFGHTLEDERRVLPRHDKDHGRASYFLEGSSIGTVLRKHGIQQEVFSILTEKGTLASDIVSGAISADLLDYLRRDNYFCGLSQFYDDRVLQSCAEQDGRFILGLEKYGMLRRDALSEVVHLLRIRYTLSERVYFHHTKLVSGAMISKVVELAITAGLKSEDLWLLKDESLFWMLRQRFPDVPGVLYLLDCLDRRQLYKPVYLLNVDIGKENQKNLEERFHFNPKERQEAEFEIALSAQLDPHQVIVYCPEMGMSLPEAEVPARLNRGVVEPLSGANNSEIQILKEKHRALWKFLVLVDRSRSDCHERVREIAEEYFGLRAVL